MSSVTFVYFTKLNFSSFICWEGQLFVNIPIPRISECASVEPLVLLVNFIAESVSTRCNNTCCQSLVEGGKIEIVPGMITTIAVNQLTYNRQLKRSEKLMITIKSVTASRDFGLLKSIISLLGSNDQGHFVTYHFIDNHWFLNDDDREAVVQDAFNSQDATETIELLGYTK